EQIDDIDEYVARDHQNPRELILSFALFCHCLSDGRVSRLVAGLRGFTVLFELCHQSLTIVSVWSAL
ncbi:MAG: hypothetical protein ACLR5G_05405, partial [Eubacteriales bacterium]